MKTENFSHFIPRIEWTKVDQVLRHCTIIDASQVCFGLEINCCKPAIQNDGHIYMRGQKSGQNCGCFDAVKFRALGHVARWP